ncbi:MAG: NUDIX hydrolase [Patescibacteria group bacterium]
MSQKIIKAVGVIMEKPDGDILVLKRHKDSLEGEKLGLVGGYIDKQEDAVSALQREAREEIGIEIDIAKLIHLKTYNWNTSEGSLTFETYKYFVNESQEIKLDEVENTAYFWMNPKDLYKRPDLMKGLYPILEDEFGVMSSQPRHPL